MCLIKMNEDDKTRRRRKKRIAKLLEMFTFSQIGDRKRRQPMKNEKQQSVLEEIKSVLSSHVSLCGVPPIKLGNSDGP